MSKKLYLLVVFFTTSVFIQAQINATQNNATKKEVLTEQQIAQHLEESRKSGTKEWEVEVKKKLLYKQKNHPATNESERNGNPQLPIVNATSCVNPGFEDGTTNGWTFFSGQICSGSTNLPCNTCPTTPGSIDWVLGANANQGSCTPQTNGYQSANGIDYYSGLPTLAPGSGNNYSLLLNNACSNGKIQKAVYSFVVTPSANIFTFQYAVVLQSGQHPANEQPYFHVDATDMTTNAVINCTQYDATAPSSGSLNGWSTSPQDASVYTYPWKSVALDLSNATFAGHTIQVNFIVSDCNQCGHFGYCYLDASCNSNVLTLTKGLCPGGGQGVLTGPPGFTSYSWTNSAGTVVSTAQTLSTSIAGTYTLNTVSATSCAAPTMVATLTNSPIPAPLFTNTLPPCSNNLTLNDGSTVSAGSIVNWQWNFGDGSPVVNSTTGSPQTHAYNPPGTYTVTLKDSTDGGCIATYTAVVNISSSGPIPVFTSNSPATAPQCFAGNNVVFTNTSTAPAGVTITGYQWDFGDGGTATSTTVTPGTSHSYASCGTFVVTLTVTSSACNAVTTQTVVINPSPTASFSAPTVCLSNGSVFTSTVASNPCVSATYTYAWAFGGAGAGSNLTTGTPTFTYSSASTFPVTLVVTAVGGCSVTATNNVTVGPGPTASFTVGPVCEGTPSVFDASASIPAAGATYIWSFGGAAPNTDVVTTQTDNHTYLASGTFPVTLIVAVGTCSATVTGSAFVNPMPTVSFSTTPVCLGTPTSFTTTLSSVGTYTYTWDYADGSLATNGAQNPSYTYGTANTYAPTLTLTAIGGCTATATAPAIVNPAPAATFTVSTVCLGSSSIFSSTITDGNTFVWNFGGAGNGTNITTATPAYTYSASGTFPVSLTVTATGGCSVTATAIADVKPIPTMVPMADQFWCPAQNTNAVIFSTVPASAASTYTWSYTTPLSPIANTGTFNPFPSLPTSNPGQTTLVVAVTVTPSLNGCVGPPSSFNISVFPNPVAKFSSTNLVCEGQAMAFTDLSTPNTGSITVNQWAWDLNNDGGIDANAQDPSFTYPVGSAGTMPITLYIGTSSVPSCTAQITEPIFVNPNPVASFVGDSLKSCPQLNTTFTDLSSVTINGVPTTSITTWAWTFGNGHTSNVNPPPQQTYTNASPTQSAYFNVSLTVTTDSGCVNKKTINSYIQVYPRPTANFGWGPAGVDIDDPTVTFYDQSLGASGYPASPPYTYGAHGIQYYLGDVFAINQNSNTVYGSPSTNTFTHVYEYYDPYTYYVTQWVINSMGCKDSITKPVEILPNFTFYIPNAFSPNGDGTNEGFKGTGMGIDNTTYSMWIFDRWGMMIFYADDLEKSWDGHMRSNEGKSILQQDVYVWKVKFQDNINHKEHEYHGTVTLLK